MKSVVSRALVVAFAALSSAGCGAGDDAGATADLAANRFDASAALPGQRVADHEIVSVDLAPSQVGGVFVGSVRFVGQVVVVGVPRVLDAEADRTLCFDVDEASTRAIPRMRHDERRVWFCFSNQDRARALLGDRLGIPAAVEIADYQTSYEFTDAVDQAALVRVVSRRPNE